MFDIRSIRENPEAFDQGLRRRGLAAQSVHLLELDSGRRSLLTELQQLQSRRNDASREIGGQERPDATRAA